MACLPTRTALAATFAPVLALIAMPASAHVFGAHGAGLGDGLAHPFAGPDISAP